MKKFFLSVSLLMFIVLFVGCGTKVVNVVEKKHDLSHVCIENNSKVEVADFIPVVIDLFHEHGISTEIYKNTRPEYCNVTMTYTASRKWDMAVYMRHAELRLYKDSQQIGYAEYHLTGGGGLDLSKWASVKSKMTPIMEELLAQYDKKAVSPRKRIAKREISEKSTIEEKLQKIDKMYKNGLITEEEYSVKRKQLLEDY